MADTWADLVRSTFGGIGNAGSLGAGHPLQWRQMASRVQITQEQIQDASNQQGAFTRAAAQEYTSISRDWQRAMESYIMGAPWREPIDPDLELDEGL